MQKMLIVPMIALSLLISAAASAAGPGDWAGYYVALDPADGSIATMSVAPSGDENLQIIVQTDQLSLCPDPTSHGFLVADGKIVDGELVRQNGRFKCDGDADFREWPQGSYRRDSSTGIVMQSGGNNGRTFFFHPQAQR